MIDPIRGLLVLGWFLAYMGVIYLGLHMLLARLIRRPESRLLWFFTVVTAPLIRPVRSLLPPGTPEGRVRAVTLGILVALWLGLRLALGRMGGAGLG
jgi:hypothetical protein